MARSPRAHVSVSSGSGVSRLSYQKGRDLGNKGVQIARGEAQSSGRQYGKSKRVDYPKGINVSYGDTYEPTDLNDIKNFLKPKA